MKTFPRAILLAALGYFAWAAAHALGAPGLYYDEVLFVNAALGGHSNSFVTKRLFGAPVMLMDYIGALKAYVYYPVFKLLGVSVATIRWPVIVISCGTLLLAYAVGRLTTGRLLAALVVLAMAVDPTFVYTTKADFGPTVLMMFLKLLALFLFLKTVTTSSTRYLWPLVAACLLGVYDKLNFIWLIVALAVAAGLLFRDELRSTYARDRVRALLPIAVLAVVLVAVALELILPQFLATQRAVGDTTLAGRLPALVGMYARTMNGADLYRWITGIELRAASATDALTAAAILVLLVTTSVAGKRAGGLRRAPLPDRMAACYLVLFVTIAAQIAVTRKASGVHHMMMLYPLHLWLCVHAVVPFRAWPASRAIGAAAAGLLIASGLKVGREYVRAMRTDGEFETTWSPVITDLARYLNASPADAIVFADWGMHNQVYALGSWSTRARLSDLWWALRRADKPEVGQQILRESFAGKRVLVALHPAGGDVIPGARERFERWARTYRLTPRLQRTFTSPRGRVIYEVYAVDGMSRS